jgi:hypothetical protein
MIDELKRIFKESSGSYRNYINCRQELQIIIGNECISFKAPIIDPLDNIDDVV